ncbi:MAG: NAD(P)/FAD-dependent oxidoreductase [Anaerofustis sp.]
MFDVIIIGAGCIGGAIARELSKYRMEIAVIDKENDVSCGASKANSGIVHGGYDAKYGTKKGEFSKRGNELMTPLSKELGFELNRCGSFVLSFDDEDDQTVQRLYENGMKNQIEGLSIVDRDFVLKREPHISDAVRGALFCSTAGIISPYEYTIALMENAVDNGVKLFLNHSVTAIRKIGEAFTVTTDKGMFQAKFVINAAGVFSDNISKMIAETDFTVRPRRGEYILFDKMERGKAGTVLFGTPKKGSKGILVSPTVHNNLIIGPSADYIGEREDTATTPEVLASVWEKAVSYVPSLERSKVITQFSGIRAVCDKDDFIIEETNVARFINVACISSPGLTTSYVIAEHVRDIVGERTDLVPNPAFNPKRKPIPVLIRRSRDAVNAMIKENPAYGRIICRCESITEGEIVDAVHRSIPATDVDAVKRRVRAGMGRCQGGFCMPKVMEIISRETGIPLEEITKKGSGSYIATGKLYDQVNDAEHREEQK